MVISTGRIRVARFKQSDSFIGRPRPCDSFDRPLMAHIDPRETCSLWKRLFSIWDVALCMNTSVSMRCCVRSRDIGVASLCFVVIVSACVFFLFVYRVFGFA